MDGRTIPFGEVPKEIYMAKHLKTWDAKNVEAVVDLIVSNQDALGFENLHVLAVGSSTFSPWYWEHMEALRKQFPDIKKNIPNTYRDINLRLLFDERKEDGVGIQKLLKDNGYEDVRWDGTAMDSVNRGRKVVIRTEYDHFLGRISGIGFSFDSAFVDSYVVEFIRGKPIEIITKFNSTYFRHESYPKNGSPGEIIEHERKMSAPFSLLSPAFVTS